MYVIVCFHNIRFSQGDGMDTSETTVKFLI